MPQIRFVAIKEEGGAPEGILRDLVEPNRDLQIDTGKNSGISPSESDKEGMHSALGLLLFLAIGGPIPLAQEIIPWNEAGKYYGQFKTVEGTIVATKNTGKVCFLNFS